MLAVAMSPLQPPVLPLLVDSSSHIHLLPNEGPMVAGDYRWASDPEQVWGGGPTPGGGGWDGKPKPQVLRPFVQ